MTDAFKNIDLGNLGNIGEDTKNKAQFLYDKAEKKYKTSKELEGGIGSLKAMVSGKKLGEAIEGRLKPIIKRKVGEEYRAFKNQWSKKAQDGIDRVLKPKGSSGATGADEPIQMSEIGEVEDEVDTVSSTAKKAENIASKAKSISSKLRNTVSKAREANAVSKEAQADKLEEETEKTEQLAKEAGFKNATTDKDIPLEVRQLTKAKYAKMGKLREDAKALRKQNEAEANDAEETNLNDSQPVSSQANSAVSNANPDASAEADANALGKAQIKSGVGDNPDNTPNPKGKGKGKDEDEDDADADADADGVIDSTVGDDVGEGVLEALGGALDDTGILAPIGLLLGAVGIGLGASKKGAPVEKTDRDNENGYSFQVGIN